MNISVNYYYTNGKNVYASNGHIAIEVQKKKLGINEKFPKPIKDNIDNCKAVTEWHEPPEIKPCECNDGVAGKGRHKEICSKCASDFAGRKIAKFYILLLRSKLTNVRFGVIKGSGKHDPVYFKFDGGRGTVMPIYQG